MRKFNVRRRWSRLASLAAMAFVLGSCVGDAGHVEYRDGACLIDGRAATLVEVEARQARLTEHIASRQPLLVAVTVLVVALAGMSHVEKLVVLLSSRGSQPHGFGERLRTALERYRHSPVRYFSVVLGSLSLLVLVGVVYVYLDAEKRASERSLGLLQFCHVALRNQAQEKVLGEQRQNLEAIQSTAGNIRQLVDGLPPEEQRKAREIVARMNEALAKQGRLVADSLDRTDAETRAVRENTETLARGLSSVEADVTSLRSLPSGLRDLSAHVQTVGGAVHGLDEKLDKRETDEAARLAAMEAELKVLAARPEPKCPACVCEERRPSPSAPSHPSAAVPTARPADGGTPAAPKEAGASSHAASAAHSD